MKNIVSTAAGFPLLAAFALLGAGNEAQAQSAPTADPFDTTPLRAEFTKTAAGGDIIDYCDSVAIPLVYDYKTLWFTNADARYDAVNARLLVFPGLPREYEVLLTSHEAKHGQQDKTIGIFDIMEKPISPDFYWAAGRYLEADAFAASQHFMATRMQEAGCDTVSRLIDPAERIVIKLLYDQITGDGLTPPEYRTIALEKNFANLSPYTPYHLEYTQGHTAAFVNAVDSAEKTLRMDPARGRDMADSLYHAVQSAPDRKEFCDILRQFGGVSYKKKAVTSLQEPAVKNKTLLNVYPYLGDRSAAKKIRAVVTKEKKRHKTAVRKLTKICRTFHGGHP